MQAGLLHGRLARVTNELAMHLPTKNPLLLSVLASLLLALLAAGGCAKVTVTRASQSYAARDAGCPVTWQHASYQQLAADYEWLGEVTLRNERGVVLSQGDRDLLEAQACQLGGDTLVRTSGVRQEGAGLAAFADQRYGVLRRRTAPAARSITLMPSCVMPYARVLAASNAKALGR